MLENAYEGLNVKNVSLSVFIQRVFFQNVPDLRVF